MRVLGLLLFLGLIGLVVWFLTGARLGTAEVGTELAVADEHVGAISEVDDLVERALDNAQRAAKLAAELEAAALAAEATAEDVARLPDNEAAAASARTARVAADDALAAARLMRNYADRMLARFQRTDLLAGEAEDAALIVETVEENQAEAERAAQRAEEAREDMLEAEATLEEVSIRAGVPYGQGDASYPDDAYAMDPYAADQQPSGQGGSIVILNDDPATVRRDRSEDDVGDRLQEIFPDDVIEYEEDVPYGERG
jgi:hypothetical protein